MKKQKVPKEKNVGYVSTYFFTVLGIVTVFLLISSVGVYAYKSNLPDPPKQVFANEDENAVAENPPEATAMPTADENKNGDLFTPPAKTTFLVASTDDTANLTDVLLVGSFDRDTQKINIMSVPRDTLVDLSQKTKDQMMKTWKFYPDYPKINGIYNLTGKEIKYTVQEIEDLLNVSIDYYAIIDTAAFRKIVDAVGGIEMTLTRNYNYWDPTQNLLIDLEKGTQILDGDKAEQFVRYRNDYVRGDAQRIEVQQEFMKEFFAQVLNKEAIISNAGEFLTTLLTYVETNFGIEDSPRYLPYVSKLNGENFSFVTMPGEDKYIGDESFFIMDEEETAEMVNRIFYSKGTKDYRNDEIKVMIYYDERNMQVASLKKDYFEAYGYNNVAIAPYDDDMPKSTRVYTRDEKYFDDARKVFSYEELNVDDELPEDIDIMAIVKEK